MKYKILISSLIAMLIVSFVIVLLVRLPMNARSERQISQVEKEIEGNNKNELNYLFFPFSENGSTPTDKSITLFFSKNVESYKFSKVELLQNGSNVSKKTKISEKDTKDNKVQILLSEYIPKFNQAKFTLVSGKIMTLDVGQFYLEKIRYPFDISEGERCILKYANTNESKNLFQNNYTLNCNNKYKIITLVSSKAKETGFTQKVKRSSQEGNDISYQYNCSIPLEYFKKENIKNINVDVIWIQEDLKSGKQYRLFTGNIPLFSQNTKPVK